ncbi:glycosyl hydrolase 53 family protein [Glycomyces endophyticus]|uniref:Arabinogalactan endo-beta-1,4-galactanase n=1 Tax=Glycomyces endophyticus TaxID=480996 RepID=A0ABP4SW70_9ACTN
MKRNSLKRLTTGLMAGALTAAVLAVGEPAAAVRSDFIMGVDVGMLGEVEDLGGRFYDDGVEGDALGIMADHGANMVRLRLWNDPYNASGDPYGGGTNDLASTIAMAQRAKAQGMDVLLDFHLSDWWADPGTQTKPKAWQNLTYAQLKTAVHDYTESVINAMEAAGAKPDMVQMGNEISSGVLWEDGRIGGAVSDFTQLGELLSAGIDGVNDAASGIEIALHLDMGGDNSLYQWWFDGITAEGVDFDVIALSYYPFWHGTMGELKQNLNDISERYSKDVLIVETAYGWTLGDGDGLGNSFYTAEEATGGYAASVQGQVDFLRDLREIVADVPDDRGRGIIWWEPTWLPVEGANWGTEAGKEDNDDTGTLSNPWDNQTLFDWDGNALATLDVFGENAATQRVNLLTNGSFEANGTYTNTPSGWTVVSANSGYANATFTSDAWPAHGDWTANHYWASAYTVSLYQNKTGLANGTYTLSGWVLSGGGQNSVYMYAKNYGGAERQAAIPASASAWTYVSIEGIQVVNGQIQVGFWDNANAGNWLNIDDVKLYRTA